MADFIEDDYDDAPELLSDDTLDGDPNTLPVISDASATVSDVAGQMKDILVNLPKTARDIGSVVGAVKGQVASAKHEYQTAVNNGATNNKIGQWWQYSSPNDKLMAILAVAGVALALYQVTRK